MGLSKNNQRQNILKITCKVIYIYTQWDKNVKFSLFAKDKQNN